MVLLGHSSQPSSYSATPKYHTLCTDIGVKDLFSQKYLNITVVSGNVVAQLYVSGITEIIFGFSHIIQPLNFASPRYLAPVRNLEHVLLSELSLLLFVKVIK